MIKTIKASIDKKVNKKRRCTRVQHLLPSSIIFLFNIFEVAALDMIKKTKLRLNYPERCRDKFFDI